MKNRNNMNFVWLVICIVCMVAFVVLGIFCTAKTAYAEEYETATLQDDMEESEDTIIQSVTSAVLTDAEEIQLQIELWQEYIDKYIMPNAIAVITGLGMVLAVFSKFKYLVNLYKENKEQFDSEKDSVFAEMKSEVSAIIETLADVKQTTQDTIDNMPISQIQEDIAKAKEALEAEMNSIVDFTRMFEIFLASERKLVDTSYLSTSDKKEMKKLFYEGEQLAKKNKTSLSDVSDFVLATIASSSEESEEIEEEQAETEDVTGEIPISYVEEIAETSEDVGAVERV